MATGTMTKVPESQVRDLDHRGAPRVCRTLRHQLFKLNKGENFEGFSYSDGLLAEPEQVGEGPDTHVRIDRCHGHPTILPTNPEPSTFDLRGGLLSWDAVTSPSNPCIRKKKQLTPTALSGAIACPATSVAPGHFHACRSRSVSKGGTVTPSACAATQPTPTTTSSGSPRKPSVAALMTDVAPKPHTSTTPRSSDVGTLTAFDQERGPYFTIVNVSCLGLERCPAAFVAMMMSVYVPGESFRVPSSSRKVGP
jgi:hypothetical protein